MWCETLTLHFPKPLQTCTSRASTPSTLLVPTIAHDQTPQPTPNSSTCLQPPTKVYCLTYGCQFTSWKLVRHHHSCQAFNSFNPNIFGSKQHIMNQFVYFAFRTIVLFGVLFLKKHLFSQKEFSNEMFWKKIIYFIYNCPNMSFFLQSNLEKYFFWKCTNFAKFCVLSWNFVIISNHTKTCWHFQV